MAASRMRVWLLTWAAAPGLALILAACADAGEPSESVPTRAPPADPAARFQELEELREAASFHVVYQEDRGFDDYEEFAWLQDGKRVRWDESNTSEDAIAGTSSIDDGAGSGLACDWVTKEGWDKAEVSCGGVPPSSGMWVLDAQLNGSSPFGEDVEFAGFRTILGAEAECFIATMHLIGDTRRICYTAQGLPLEIDSVVAAGGGGHHRILLTAKEIRPPPSKAELLTPIIPDAPLGQEVTLREIPLEDLVLPSLPIVEDFFSESAE